MLSTMLIGFYTSRITLQVLGVVDYGIYNIVAGITISFAIFSDTLTGSITRFLTVDLGNKDYRSYQKTFSHALELYVLLAIFTLLLLETFGIWFIENEINIPAARREAANITFQFTCFYFILTMLRLPFDSVIISNEKMNFYAYIGMGEAILKLANAFLLQRFRDIDSLVLYVILVDIVALIILIIIACYVFFKFRFCRFTIIWEKSIARQILSFSGWSMFSSVTAMASNQGIDVLLNRFGGVIVNAGMGIANQVAGVINNLVLNFQTALKPQIVKCYISGNHDDLYKLAFRGGKFSFFLLLLPIVPLLIELPYYLNLWLGQTPKYTVAYCTFVIIALLFETMSGPLWMLAQAYGRIKKYQLCVSSIFFLNFLLSLSYLVLEYDISYVIIIRDIVYFSLLIARCILLKNMINFPSLSYFKNVICRCILVGTISISVPIITQHIIGNTSFRSLIISFISFIWTLIVVLVVGVNRDERNSIFNIIFRMFKRDNSTL